MPSRYWVQTNNETRSEPERKVEETDALLRETVQRLSQRCPPHVLEAAAHDDLVFLWPHLEEAIAALVDIERQRSLTDEEVARRRAFKLLLAATRYSDHMKGWARSNAATGASSRPARSSFLVTGER
jgi:hypothetical protein